MTHGSTAAAWRQGEEICLWQEFTVSFRFPVLFTRHVFSPENPALAEVAGLAGRPAAVFPVADDGVVGGDPALAKRIGIYAAAHPEALRLVAPLHVFAGGERCKEGPDEVEKLRLLFLQHRLCRHSVVLAIGGGAFLDVAGYAASTAHRGIRLFRFPSTTLAQNDAGIGVKNGYNAFGRKNWVGTFAPPFAVINDFEFLRTLPPRHCRSGIAEAVKVAVIKDAAFFRFLYMERKRLAAFRREPLEEMILRSARIHMDHIAGGDPFERGSARPLDFGHWSAHALEDLSRGDIVHGEAVAIGMALDTCYAREAGLVSNSDEERILGLLRDLGFALFHPLLARLDLRDALDRFREHLGGELAVTLPTAIGRGVEVRRMDMPLLHRSRERLISHSQRGQP